VENNRETYPVDTPEDHEKVEQMMSTDPLFNEHM
jgi:3-deoxy-manno-octulosonate cytidylyltransferase (CMP-KDO synthetase)